MAVQTKPSSTIATARVDRLIGRALAAGSVLFSLEGFANFYSQLPLLNQPLAWAVMGVIWATTAGYFITFWFGSANYLYLRIHAIAIACLPFLWPILVIKNPEQDGSFYPFIWWVMSTGWLAAALGFKMRWVITYFIGLNIATQYVFSTPIGGSHELINLILDGEYTILTNGSIAVIALMLRFAANRSDVANSERMEAAILEAQVEAQAKERSRLDALVHDSVLTALISAGRADTVEEVKLAADLANIAIQRLQTADGVYEASASVLCSSLFDSVISAARRIDPEIEYNKNCLTSFTVNGEIASALTEATIQAVHNSVLHAGGKAKRELHLKSSQGTLKLVVKDDGVGFRPNRVPRERLGIRLSIQARIESIGGKAHIVSAPRKGTTVVLEWSQA
jgi:signal transduction histidine kinase